MTCSEVESKLPKFLQKKLPLEEEQKLKIHLEACPACQEYFLFLSRLTPHLTQWRSAFPPKDLSRRTWRRLQRMYFRKLTVTLRRFWLRRRRTLVIALFLLGFFTALFGLYAGPNPQGVEVHYSPQAVPGQIFSMNLVVTNRVSQLPIANTSFEIFLIPPRSSPLLLGRYKTNQHGIAHPRFLLPPHLPPGQYTLQICLSSYPREKYQLPLTLLPPFQLEVFLSSKIAVPGEKIYLLAILRSLPQGYPLLGYPVTFRWKTKKGMVFFEQTISTSSYGSALLPFRWPKSFPLGEYQLEVESQGQIQRTSFRLVPPKEEGPLPFKVSLSSFFLSPKSPKISGWITLPSCFSQARFFLASPHLTISPSQGTFPSKGKVKFTAQLKKPSLFKTLRPFLLYIQVSTPKGYRGEKRITLWGGPTPYHLRTRVHYTEELAPLLSLSLENPLGEPLLLPLKIQGRKTHLLPQGKGTLLLEKDTQQVLIYLTSTNELLKKLYLPQSRRFHLSFQKQGDKIYVKTVLPFPRGQLFANIYQGSQLVHTQVITLKPRDWRGVAHFSFPARYSGGWLQLYQIPPPQLFSPWPKVLASSPTFEIWETIPTFLPPPRIQQSSSKLTLKVSSSSPYYLFLGSSPFPQLLSPSLSPQVNIVDLYREKLDQWALEQDLWLSLFFLFTLLAFYLSLWERKTSLLWLFVFLSLSCVSLLLLHIFLPTPAYRPFLSLTPSPSSISSSPLPLSKPFGESQFYFNSKSLPAHSSSPLTVSLLAPFSSLKTQYWKQHFSFSPPPKIRFLLPKILPLGFQAKGYLYLHNPTSSSLSLPLKWHLKGVKPLSLLPSILELPPHSHRLFPLIVQRTSRVSQVTLSTPYGEKTHLFLPVFPPFSTSQGGLSQGDFFFQGPAKLRFYPNLAWILPESSFFKEKYPFQILPSPPLLFTLSSLLSSSSKEEAFFSQTGFFLLFLTYSPLLSPSHLKVIREHMAFFLGFLLHLHRHPSPFSPKWVAWGYFLTKQAITSLPKDWGWKFSPSLLQDLLHWIRKTQDMDGSWSPLFSSTLASNRERLSTTAHITYLLLLAGVRENFLRRSLSYLSHNVTSQTETLPLLFIANSLALWGGREKLLKEVYSLLLERGKQLPKGQRFWEGGNLFLKTALAAYALSRRRSYVSYAQEAYSFLASRFSWEKGSPLTRFWIYHSFTPWYFSQTSQLLSWVAEEGVKKVISLRAPVEIKISKGTHYFSTSINRWILFRVRKESP